MDVFEAVAEPTRRAVLDLLVRRERSAGELVAAFPALTQPAVSRHLCILRESQLVDVRPDGTRRIYSLRPAALAEIELQGLAGLRIRRRRFPVVLVVAIAQVLQP